MLPCAKLLKPGMVGSKNLTWKINRKNLGEVWNFSSFCSQGDRRCRGSWTNKRTVKHCQKDGGQQHLGHQSPQQKTNYQTQVGRVGIFQGWALFVNLCWVLAQKNITSTGPTWTMPKKPENVAAHVQPWGATRGYTDSLWRLEANGLRKAMPTLKNGDAMMLCVSFSKMGIKEWNLEEINEIFKLFDYQQWWTWLSDICTSRRNHRLFTWQGPNPSVSSCCAPSQAPWPEMTWNLPDSLRLEWHLRHVQEDVNEDVAIM